MEIDIFCIYVFIMGNILFVWNSLFCEIGWVGWNCVGLWEGVVVNWGSSVDYGLLYRLWNVCLNGILFFDCFLCSMCRDWDLSVV